MLHNLTIGASMSGKSTLNKLLAAGYQARGLQVFVLDPMRDEGWQADYQTHDPELFLSHVRSHPHAALFIDESGTALDRYDRRFDWLATTGRHLGHVSHFIAHRLKQLSPTIRGQALKRWVFRSSRDDAGELANEHAFDALATAATLNKGEFFLVEPFKPLRKGLITWRKGAAPLVKFSEV